MSEAMIIKKYELKQRLFLLEMEWSELEEDLRLIKRDHWETEEALEQLEQEIKEETNV